MTSEQSDIIKNPLFGKIFMIFYFLLLLSFSNFIYGLTFYFIWK